MHFILSALNLTGTLLSLNRPDNRINISIQNCKDVSCVDMTYVSITMCISIMYWCVQHVELVADAAAAGRGRHHPVPVPVRVGHARADSPANIMS